MPVLTMPSRLKPGASLVLGSTRVKASLETTYERGEPPGHGPSVGTVGSCSSPQPAESSPSASAAAARREDESAEDERTFTPRWR